MATTFDLQVSCVAKRAPLIERLLLEAHRVLEQLESELSEFRPMSPVAKLNQSRPGERILMSRDGAVLLARSLDLATRTKGAFDPTAKSVGDRGGIQLDRATGEAWRKHPGAHLSFGAIGKGFALDRLRALLATHDVTDYVLSAGGSSQILCGFQAPGIPWTWGWSWEKSSSIGIRFAHHSGECVALGVSGTEQKGDHLIPAPSRKPAKLRSALVASNSAADADALSTALFVGGWDEAISHFKAEWTPPALAAIDHQETPLWNGTFSRLWGPIASAASSTLQAGLLLLLLIPVYARSDDSSVDLDALSGPSFTPYLFERNAAWILLPLLSLIALALHLKRGKPRNLGDQKNENPPANP